MTNPSRCVGRPRLRNDAQPAAGLFNLDEFRHAQERLSAFELLLLEEGAVSPEGLKRRQREYLSMKREDR